MPFLILPWEDIALQYHQGTILLGNGESMAFSPSIG